MQVLRKICLFTFIASIIDYLIVSKIFRKKYDININSGELLEYSSFFYILFVISSILAILHLVLFIRQKMIKNNTPNEGFYSILLSKYNKLLNNPL